VARPRRSRRSLTVLLLVFASLTIITIDESGRTHNVTSGIKSVANGIFQPIRSGTDAILEPVGDFFAGSVHYGALQQENEKLQATVGQLRQQVAEQQDKDAQLKELLTLEHLPFLDSLPTVVAQTTEIGTSNFTATINIDQGRDDGVDVGDPVVGAGGLIGQVIQAYHSSAIVQLITDGQSKVGVLFGNQAVATVDGQGPGNPMTADFISPGTKLSRGELMVTSSFEGGEYPRGIPVGRVTSFRNTPGATQETVSVAPVANFNTLGYVDVIEWEPTP
jgi:rod shape-determining protein MreC